MLTFTAIAIIKWESPVAWSVNFGIAMAILVGVAKEFFDLVHQEEQVQRSGLVADAVGIIVSVFIIA